MEELAPLATPDLGTWQERLAHVVEMMQAVSRERDPQSMVREYASRVRRMQPYDSLIAISRRGLPAPQYRITRSSKWKEDVNPWKEKGKLPLFDHGILGDLLYAGEPRLFQDFVAPVGDPAYEYLKGERSLFCIPSYDSGESLNMTVLTRHEPNAFDPERLPDMLLQSNLFGRFTQNLVLAEELKAAYAIVDRELQVVAAIQRSLLPAELPQIPGLDVAAHYQTSRQAGGDYYDFFALPDGRWGVFVADVSGHGTPAAVVMAVTHTIAHSFPGPPAPPSQMLGFLNEKLMAPYASGSGTFVTAFYGVYDPVSRKFTYSSAGHNPPLLRHGKTGKTSSLDGAQSLPLGIIAGEKYFDSTQQLEPYDKIVLYTDGITEARDVAGAMWGVEGLDAAIPCCTGGAKESLESLLSSLATFTGDRPADDDRTMLIMQVK